MLDVDLTSLYTFCYSRKADSYRTLSYVTYPSLDVKWARWA
jgi:hypothetical protein